MEKLEPIPITYMENDVGVYLLGLNMLDAMMYRFNCFIIVQYTIKAFRTHLYDPNKSSSVVENRKNVHLTSPGRDHFYLAFGECDYWGISETNDRTHQ